MLKAHFERKFEKEVRGYLSCIPRVAVRSLGVLWTKPLLQKRTWNW